MNRKNRIIAAILAVSMILLGSILPSPVSAQGSRYSLTIVNDSSFDIERLYVSSSDFGVWGPDQLGLRVLRSGDTFTLTGIKPGEYDIKFVDQDGDTCILRYQVFRNLSWRLTNSWLLGCESR